MTVRTPSSAESGGAQPAANAPEHEEVALIEGQTASSPVTEPESALLSRMRAAAELLEAVESDRGLLARVPEEDRQRLLRATRQVSHPDPRARRRLVKATTRERRAQQVKKDESLFQAAGIRELRRKPPVTSPNVYPPPDFLAQDVDEAADLAADRVEGRDRPGGPCSYSKSGTATSARSTTRRCITSTISSARRARDFNFAKRTESADLRGRVALLTGGRVKIGYQAGLKLLRAGAQLIVTTRFPRDSALRYAREADFAEWADRLEIFGLDLRHTPSVEAFCRLMLTRNDPRSGSTSSSTTPARPCAGRPSSIAT